MHSISQIAEGFVNNILKLVQIEDFNNTSVLTTKEDVESLFYFINI